MSTSRDANVRAFLRVIRAGESSQDAMAYRMLFGGKIFDSFADHPRIAIKSKWGWTSAAGAYQAMCAVPGKVKTDTWGDFIRSQGPHDFSPESQDKFAIWCIKRRGALKAIEEGFLEVALKLCAREWASLPGSPYGQPTLTLDKARAVYRGWGGKLSDEMSKPEADFDTSGERVDAVESDSTQQPPPAPPERYMPAGELVQEQPMAPFVAAALQAILPAVPKLIDTFGSGSEVSKRNEKAAELVVSVAKEALGAVNEQEVADRLKNDPSAPSIVRSAVEAQWFAITQEVGGGVAAARAADVAYLAPESKGFWHSPVFWITVLLLPLVYIALYAVLFRAGFSNDIKAMVLGAIFGGLLTGGIQSYFYGTSASSAKKTDMIGGRA